MKRIKYKLIVLFLICNGVIQAQKFTKEFTKEISSGKNTIELLADYADIEIIEWNKNKIKIEAVMTVEGIAKNEAENFFKSWDINLLKDDKEIKIISKNNKKPRYKGYFFDKKLENTSFEMPEISLESLGILDSMNFSFPEINFSEILNDTIFTRIYKYDFNYLKKDSVLVLDAEVLKKNIESLKKWQSDNKENFERLQESRQMQKYKRKELLGKIDEFKSKRIKEQNKRRKELLKKINKLRTVRKNNVEKRRNQIIKNRKKLRKSRDKIREILENRRKSKIRTKLKIQVPKGTKFIMEINYSKVTTP